MDEPKIGKYPTEIFGKAYVEYANMTAGEIVAYLDSQQCPFTNSECTKFRKSDPSVKIGTCSLGMPGEKAAPNVICPTRIATPEILKHIKRIAFGDSTVRVLKEVGMRSMVFDYVFVKCDNEEVEDFCIVEFHTGSTTGTPWGAVQDLRKHGKYMKQSYGYGFNLAHQYQKTMMPQVYKKGVILEEWGKHLFYLLQDVGMNYLRRSAVSDMSGLENNPTMDIAFVPKLIHFLTFAMVWEDSTWNPKIVKMDDATSSDVAKMLGHKKSNSYNLEKFITHLNEMLPKSKPI